MPGAPRTPGGDPLKQFENYRDHRAQSDAGGVKSAVKGFRLDSNFAISAVANGRGMRTLAAIVGDAINFPIAFPTIPQAALASALYAPLLRIINACHFGDGGEFTAQGIFDNAIANYPDAAIPLAHGLRNQGFKVV